MIEGEIMGYPDWVLRHKTAGTNISRIKGKYYLYAVSSVWNKEKGRAQKVTNEYLGRITEDGLIPPKKKRPLTPVSITVKEYGASKFLSDVGQDIFEKLAEVFPGRAEKIFSIAAIRAMHHCPFKRVEFFYGQSYLSEIYGKINLSNTSLTSFLRETGSDREKITEFLNHFASGSKHLIFDATNIMSKSKKMDINRAGYNSHRQFGPQVNLLYTFAIESRMPVYYRITPGNIRDVTALKLTITESGLKDVIIVADKGFGSHDNFDMLDREGLNYIIPLKRNSALFDKDIIKQGDKSNYDGYFIWQKRPVWYYRKVVGGKPVTVFLDESLKASEEGDYLNRVEKKLEGYTRDRFLEKQYDFGTIIIRTNLDRPADEIYGLYKERGEIEQSFDFLKNLLEQDKSYMQNEKSLEAWAFINHLTLLLNYKIYNLLRVNKKLLKKYSVTDLISHLKYIFKTKVDDKWYTTEISKKTDALLNDLGLHIT
jgi:hypothetical protein